MSNDYDYDNIFVNDEEYVFINTKNDFDSDSNEDIITNNSISSSQNKFSKSNTDNTEPDIEEIFEKDSFNEIPNRGINNIFYQNTSSYNSVSDMLFDEGDLISNSNYKKDDWGMPCWEQQPDAQYQMEVEDIDFSKIDASIIAEEQAYQNQEIVKKARPVIDQALYQQKAQMNEELHQVLNNSIGYRLDDYEKRRRSRKLKERINLFIKLGVAALIISLFIVNPQLRKRTTIVFNDFGILVHGLVNGENVNSNTLVDDLFKNLDEDLEEQDKQEQINNQNN